MASSSGRKVNRKNSFSSSGTPSRSKVGEERSVLTVELRVRDQAGIYMRTLRLVHLSESSLHGEIVQISAEDCYVFLIFTEERCGDM